MPALGLLTGTERDNIGDTPTLPLVNMYVVESKTEPGQFKLIGRPPLRYVWTSTPGEARAFYQRDGVLSAAASGVYGSTWRSPSDDTAITGSLVPSIAGNAIAMICTAGAEVLFDDDSIVRTVSFPDGANVRKVEESQGRFIFLRDGTHQFYWTEPLANAIDGSGDLIIDPLDYASAESEPDELRDLLIYRGNLVLFGSETVEIHVRSGDDNLPWTPMVGSTLDAGILETGCATNWDNTFCWIDREYTIYRYTGSGKQKISTEGVERQMRAYGVDRLDSFVFEGREFLRVWLDEDALSNTAPDLLLDARTMEWCEWSTYDGEFLGGPPAPADGYLGFKSKSDGRSLYLSRRNIFIQGSPEGTVKYQFRAGAPLDGGAETVHNLLLRCQTDIASTIDMRTSDDGGQTWSATDTETLDDPRNKIEWRSLGMFDQPGFLADFEVEDTEFSVSAAYINEFVRGRARA